jgi:hypothetical protein
VLINLITIAAVPTILVGKIHLLPGNSFFTMLAPLGNKDLDDIFIKDIFLALPELP